MVSSPFQLALIEGFMTSRQSSAHHNGNGDASECFSQLPANLSYKEILSSLDVSKAHSYATVKCKMQTSSPVSPTLSV